MWAEKPGTDISGNVWWVGGAREHTCCLLLLFFLFSFMDRRNKRRLYTCFILWDKKKTPLKSESFVKPPQVQCCFFHLYLEENLFQNTSTSGISVGLGKQKKSFAFRRKQTKAGEKWENKGNQEGGRGGSQCIKVLYKRVNLQKKKKQEVLWLRSFCLITKKNKRTDCQNRERGHMLQHWKHFFFFYISSDASGTPCLKYFLSHSCKTHPLKHCRTGFSQRRASVSQPCFKSIN